MGPSLKRGHPGALAFRAPEHSWSILSWDVTRWAALGHQRENNGIHRSLWPPEGGQACLPPGAGPRTARPARASPVPPRAALSQGCTRGALVSPRTRSSPVTSIHVPLMRIQEQQQQTQESLKLRSHRKRSQCEGLGPTQRLSRRMKQYQHSFIFLFLHWTNEGKKGEIMCWPGLANSGIPMVIDGYIMHYHGNETCKITIMLAEVI